MLSIKQIDHINMRVNNLRRSIDFYHDLFGFDIKERGLDSDNQPWAIIGSGGSAYLCMYQHPDQTISDDTLTLDHFGLVIENFDEIIHTLKAQQVEYLYDGPVQWPQSRSVYIHDPSGHVIELTERVGGGLH